MERVRLARSLAVIISSAAKMGMFLVADFFLYWILSIVYRHGQFKAHVDSEYRHSRAVVISACLLGITPSRVLRVCLVGKRWYLST